MMIIYRVENKDGRGPYNARGTNSQIDAMLDEHNQSKNHPTPWHDGIAVFDSCHYCGFLSMNDLELWFNSWLPMLKKNGYNIVQVEVESQHIKFGYSQLMFDITKVLKKEVIN